METLDKGAVEAVAALARCTGSQMVSVSLPEKINGLPSFVPVLVHPETGKVTGLYDQLAPWRTRPERKTGTARAETLESFIELVELHKLGNSVIFAETDWTKPAMTAVIDYHNADSPDNGKHRIHYKFPLSEEWKAWLAIDGKSMNQAIFAEFIEDHIADLSSPDMAESEDYEKMFGAKVGFPNDIVQLSRGLQINAETRVKQAVKLQSGESQIMFEEDHKTAGGEPLMVPGVFVLQIAPFFMGETTRIPVRLRYRLREGALTWICQLYRPDRYITEQVRTDLETAADKTGLPKFEGSPEMTGA
ncbi:DUF2303 family protein [Rhizobium sp. Root482]|uniref:DUF2303 family protein n=1 Tax=Rhizobium sp. Root482 TaxID=1736543 RepID=UPI0006F830E5|nr:DUF2303 family protein [Rhizobium sp. Root482]KQY27206.1 hypothetical protein ASD31_03215 [Rhizobium sp. Root482]